MYVASKYLKRIIEFVPTIWDGVVPVRLIMSIKSEYYVIAHDESKDLAHIKTTKKLRKIRHCAKAVNHLGK